MSDLNTEHNRLVWFDIPVTDVERAATFYRAVLGIEVHVVPMGEGKLGVLEHHDGNGGCLVHDPESITRQGGILVYLNAAGRIRDAVRQAERLGGRVLEPILGIGEHGFRAVVADSEGNRIGLHSPTDA
jgi:predicted enzyme related to lactoylglutathione lyase